MDQTHPKVVEGTLQVKLKFSVVVPLFKVEEYIQDLLDSFALQESGGYEIEYIFIDDGSPDASGDIVEEWISKSSLPAYLIRQENQGVSAARNAGIEAATGNWITFPDSDDFVDRSYFKNVAEFIGKTSKDEVTIIAANIVRYFDEGKFFKNSHALRFKFAKGNAVVDIEQNPEFIQLSAPTTFYRTDELKSSGIRFRVGLHASEDALFTSEVLLNAENPKMGVVRDSRYFYRKRASETSAVDGFRNDPNSYFERFEKGYLSLIDSAITSRGFLPRWLTSLILYEYRWLFLYETNLKSKAVVLSRLEKALFIDLTRKILSSIKPGQIEDYRVTPMQYETRLLLQALAGEKFPKQAVFLDGYDPDLEFSKITYWYTDELPAETISCYGRPVQVVNAKTQSLDYFGQSVLKKRILWVEPSSQLEIEINGESMPISHRLPPLRTFQRTRQAIQAQFGVDLTASFRVVKLSTSGRSKVLAALAPMGVESQKDVGLRAIRSARRRLGVQRRTILEKKSQRDNADLRKKLTKASKSAEAKRNYADAWLLMDRVDAGGDSAEHLYRYIKSSKPEINVWFALHRDSRDWNRLQSEGFKLIDYGSFEFKLALSFAKNLVSSHADIEMTEPVPQDAYPQKRKPWKFVFLQHGVIQSDLSGWLNQKDIDLFITTTRDEYESIAGDDTPYKYSAKDTALTGLPRHDNLLKLAATIGSDKKYILISPTWRHFLVKPKVIGSGERAAASDFYESDFYLSWMSLLTDQRLIDLAARNGLEIAFLPHPNLEEAMAEVSLDSRIKRMSYRHGQIQELFAQSAVLITDYSSIAFDLAYIDAEIHYFQFDKEDMFGGKHTMSEGYYDHEIDGFGPVHGSVDSILDGGEVALLGISDQRKDIYADRVRKTFAFHDSGASERVVAAVEKLRKPSKTA
ncbi:CDP-glycerol glycerophosphotransferase family protein [Jonesiaceae bacterium BS-20]|uniref:CDP-glycerol glycerophosphotransferase family protein n=1 Tax=Jonesiaceae bacterium BS-20 TaxID=3120821 RepID=A0AAU7DW91_9MICO